MIVKPYSPSKYAERMSELVERLSPEHPQYKRISKEIGAIKGGDYGEEIVYKELEQLNLPYKSYIFHKMYLYGEFAFELDFLLITPFGAVILEVKNIIGELTFSTNPSQLIQRKEDGKVNKYPCPATQLNEYKYQLSQFFLLYNISIPIHGAVIFASKNSFIKQSSSEAKIIYRNEMRSYLRNLTKNNSILSQEKIERITDILLKRLTSTQSPTIPLIDHFSIPFQDLKLGVKCESCGFIGMQKILRTWFCPNCKQTNSNAHLKTISTYFSLYKETITNKECRHFLLLNNRYEAKRILNKSGLVKIGKSSTTYYKLEID